MENVHPLHNLTLGQILDQTVEKFPGNDALVYVDRDFRLTYREFSDVVDEMARGLMALGVQKGEKVAIWATNIPYWIAGKRCRSHRFRCRSRCSTGSFDWSYW